MTSVGGWLLSKGPDVSKKPSNTKPGGNSRSCQASVLEAEYRYVVKVRLRRMPRRGIEGRLSSLSMFSFHFSSISTSFLMRATPVSFAFRNRFRHRSWVNTGENPIAPLTSLLGTPFIIIYCTDASPLSYNDFRREQWTQYVTRQLARLCIHFHCLPFD